MKQENFYVYTYSYPNGLPFYVGKGCGRRLNTHLWDARKGRNKNKWTGSGVVTATGATNLMATNSATFDITGVQLEVGSVATPFERRPYGTELALCQRYFYRQTSDGSTTNFYLMLIEGSNNAAGPGGNFPSPMRTVPTPTFGAGIRFYSVTVGVNVPAINVNRCSSTTAALEIIWVGTSGTLGQASTVFRGNSDGYIDYSAEL